MLDNQHSTYPVVGTIFEIYWCQVSDSEYKQHFFYEADFVNKIYWVMTAITSNENLRQNKSRLSLIVEQIMTLAATTNLI